VVGWSHGDVKFLQGVSVQYEYSHLGEGRGSLLGIAIHVSKLDGKVARVLEVQQRRGEVGALTLEASLCRATCDAVLGADVVEAVPLKRLEARGRGDIVLADRVGVVPVDWELVSLGFRPFWKKDFAYI